MSVYTTTGDSDAQLIWRIGIDVNFILVTTTYFPEYPKLNLKFKPLQFWVIRTIWKISKNICKNDFHKIDGRYFEFRDISGWHGLRKLQEEKLFDLNPGKKVDSDKKSEEAISDRCKQNNKVIVVKEPGKLKG